MARMVGVGLVAVMVLAGGASVFAADQDPAQPTLEGSLRRDLIGRWEGTVVGPGHIPGGTRENRTLVIDDIVWRDGQWVVSARYGITTLTPHAISIEVTASVPVLRFRTGAGSTVVLTLSSRGNHLSGTFRSYGQHIDAPSARMSLVRVSVAAGERR